MKKQKQSFVVLGLGRFGSSVARSLCELGHEVLAVDRDEKLVENIAPDVTQALMLPSFRPVNTPASAFDVIDVFSSLSSVTWPALPI